jgi:hypothetical protein
VPETFFFDGALNGGAGGNASVAPMLPYLVEFLATSDGLSLSAAFVRIRSVALRRCIVGLVEQLGDG